MGSWVQRARVHNGSDIMATREAYWQVQEAGTPCLNHTWKTGSGVSIYALKLGPQ